MVKEYAQRWREVVVHIDPLLIDKELTTILVETFKTPSYERIISNPSTNFIDMVIIAKRMEYGIKVKKKILILQ